ncbi:MAG: hypothetical protein L6R41_001569 [Letrouitia leprolyta]|nr:MAG: hypothetical protein L6R41_001569 [Letrouitia leprolyta]
MAQASNLKESAKEKLQKTSLFASYACIYGISRPVRSSIKKHDTIVPKSIRARRKDKDAKTERSILPCHKCKHCKENETLQGEGILPKDPILPHIKGDAGRSDTANRTGYLSLPPELRLQILEQTLVTGKVRPYRGQTAQENWQRDLDIVIAAHRRAWRALMRYPSRINFGILWEVIESYLTVLVGDTASLCVPAMEVAPHFLSVCRTVYEEGHAMFYSQNTFYLPYGPLSHAKGYFDRLQSDHRKLIRKMVLDITIWDLDITAFDEIENQLRSKDVVKGRLPPDKSVEDWVPPIAYNLISTWRSKLAWLRDWTWLEEVVISSYLSRPMDNFITNFPNVSPGFAIRQGGTTLPDFLKGIGPAESHCPVLDCYCDCNDFFGLWMRCVEAYTWALLQKMIRTFGWKCSKALIRRFAYDSVMENKR